jgi:hypothetical protein
MTLFTTLAAAKICYLNRIKQFMLSQKNIPSIPRFVEVSDVYARYIYHGTRIIMLHSKY